MNPVSPSKRAFEKCKPRGLFSEFYGILYSSFYKMFVKSCRHLNLYKTDNDVFSSVSSNIHNKKYQKTHDEVLAISFKIEVD